MEKNEFREKLIELANSLEEEEEEFSNYDYDKRDFISFIMSYGREMYHGNIDIIDPDTVLDAASAHLGSTFNDIPYFSVRAQKYCIAIAAPVFIRDAPNTIAKALGIVPEVFTEVSGPMSTVLIIDCEKQYLRKAYLGIGEDEWLL